MSAVSRKGLNGHSLSVDDVRNLRQVWRECDAIEAEADPEDKVQFWAQRLAGDIEWRLDQEKAA